MAQRALLGFSDLETIPVKTSFRKVYKTFQTNRTTSLRHRVAPSRHEQGRERERASGTALGRSKGSRTVVEVSPAGAACSDVLAFRKASIPFLFVRFLRLYFLFSSLFSNCTYCSCGDTHVCNAGRVSDCYAVSVVVESTVSTLWAEPRGTQWFHASLYPMNT